MEEVCRVNLMHHGGSGTTCHNRISTQHICSEFFQFPAYRCVAWSADNLIAYSAADADLQAHDPATPTPSGSTRQKLYIASANVPEEHATVVTPHKWAIRFLEWAPATLGGPLLLSADHEKICIWEMKDNVTEWGEDEPASRAKKPIKILDFEGTVGLKWLNADPKYTLHTPSANAPPTSLAVPPRNLDEKFLAERSSITRSSSQVPLDRALAPAGVPCFLHVSASGAVHVFYKKMFDERWGVVNLPGRLHAADFTIAHVDISRNAAGTVVIAAAGTFSHIGPAICLFELGIDLTKGSCTSRLISSIPLNPLLRPDGAVSRPSVLTHLAFDPASHGKALLTVSSDMAKGSKSVMTRWEYKTSAAPLSSAWAEISASLASSTSASTSSPSSSPAVQIATPPPATPTSSTISTNTLPTYTGWQFTEVVADAAGGEVESDDEPSGSFVTALHHASGLVFVGYLNGLLEIRDSATLQVLHSMPQTSTLDSVSSPSPRKRTKLVHETAAGQEKVRSGEELLKHAARALSKSLDHHPLVRTSSRENAAAMDLEAKKNSESAATAGHPEIPMAFCLSPNSTCVAMVNSAGALGIYHLGPLPLHHLERDQEDLVVRYVADMLELSLVRLYDWWDILVWLSLGPFTHEVIRKVLTQVMIDTSGLDGVAQRFYGMHIESLKATSFMLMGGEDTLFVDGVARQTVGYLHDFLASVLDVDPKATAQLENLAAGGLQPILQKFPKTDNQTLDAVEGLAEWGLDLLVFFQKNVHHFVAMKASELAQELLTPAMVQADKKACPASPAAATTAISPPHAYNLPQSLLSLPPSSPLCQRLPMISLVLDRKFLESLRRVAGYAAVIMYHLHQRQQAQQAASGEAPAAAGNASAGAAAGSGAAGFSSLPYSLKDLHTLYTFVSALLSTLSGIVQKGVASPLEALSNLHAGLQAPAGQQALDISSFSSPRHDLRQLFRRLSLVSPPTGLLHRIHVKRKEELAGEGHGDADGAVGDASAEVKLQPRKRSAPSAPPPAPAAAGALLRQRLQGKYDVLTGIALDPTRLSSVRQCTRCNRVTGWQGAPLTGTTGDVVPQPQPTALSIGPQGFARFATWSLCCPLCGGRWRKVTLSAPVV